MAFRCFDQTTVACCLNNIGLRGLGRIGRCRLACVVLALCVALAVALSLPITVGLAFAVLALLLFASCFHFTLCFAQKSQIVFSVLLKVLGGDPVAGQLRIARQLVVLVNDLLGRAAHFALRTGTVKDTVYDVAAAVVVAVAIVLGP